MANNVTYYENRNLLFDLLIQEMSKSRSEKQDVVFKRIASLIELDKTTDVERAWEELKEALPEVLDQYTYLTNVQKENVLIKSVLGDDAYIYPPKENLEICKAMSAVYEPSLDIDTLFNKVSLKITSKYSGEELKQYWFDKLINMYKDLPITIIDLARLESIESKFKDQNKNTNEPLIENIFNVEPLPEVEETIIDIPQVEVVKPIKGFVTTEVTKEEPRENVLDRFKDSDCIFKQVGEDQFEIIKGSIKFTKEDVLRYFNNQKSVVLDDKEEILGKNYF